MGDDKKSFGKNPFQRRSLLKEVEEFKTFEIINEHYRTALLSAQSPGEKERILLEYVKEHHEAAAHSSWFEAMISLFPHLSLQASKEHLSMPPVKLDYDRRRILIDDEWVELRDEEACMLDQLFKANGAWVAGSQAHERAAQIKKKMPPTVRNLIESHHRKGYRIPLLLPK